MKELENNDVIRLEDKKFNLEKVDTKSLEEKKKDNQKFYKEIRKKLKKKPKISKKKRVK